MEKNSYLNIFLLGLQNELDFSMRISNTNAIQKK
jgi:hypothetical protein